MPRSRTFAGQNVGEVCRARSEMAFAHCELVNIVVGLFEGQDHRDVNAPGDRSLVALVRSAVLEPARSTVEFRAEAMRAQKACATADDFAARQLRARALRYARAAELIEVQCAACAAPCAAASFGVDPGILGAGVAPEPPPGT